MRARRRRGSASGSTATLAPTRPILSPGLASFSASATLTSEAKDGVEVCSTDQLVIAGERQDVVEPQPRRRRVDQLAAGHQRRRLRQPGRVPERADLALCLVARARPAVEPVEGRRVQKQGLHHTGLSPSMRIRPPGSTRNSWSRQNAAAAEATQKDGKRQNIAQRQQPQPAARQVEPARDRRGRSPAQQQRRRTSSARRPSRSANQPRQARRSSACASMTEPAKPAGAIIREVRAQRSSCRHRLAK